MSIKDVTMHFFNSYFRTDEPPLAYVSSVIFEHKPYLVSLVFTVYGLGGDSKGILQCMIGKDRNLSHDQKNKGKTSFAISYDEIKSYKGNQAEYFAMKFDEAMKKIQDGKEGGDGNENQ